MNYFIQPPPPSEPMVKPHAGPEGVPNRFFVQLSQSEIRPGPPGAEEVERSVVWLFDGFSAEWFESQRDILPVGGWDVAAWDEYFLAARVFVLEVEIPFKRLETGELQGEAFSMIHRADQQGEEPVEWFELVVQDIGAGPNQPEQIPAWVYPNLYLEGIRAALSSLKLVHGDQSTRLERAVNIDHLATFNVEQEVESALKSLPSDWVVIYDVGQGNAIGICDTDGKVACYCDLGGGVMGNRKTFPAALSAFCFERQPAVILTHWDFDHWSSANLTGGQASWSSTWIAPRQRPLGVSHHTLMRQIRRHGKLLLIPASFTSGWRGRFHLERCTGRGRNHSGLAVTLSERSNGSGQTMLFPGDACYDHIPSFKGSAYLSVVAPHHGGDMKSSTTPPAPPSSSSRLVYSFGIGNTFSHPRNITRSNHHHAGWRDPKAKGVRVRGAHEVRDTEDRTSVGLGHVLLDWSMAATLPSTCCRNLKCACRVAGNSCDLQAQQL